MTEERHNSGDASTRPSAEASDAEARTSVVGAPPTISAARAGAIVGRYVVLEEVGRGGMGRVLRAYDPKLQREVALKEVRSDMLDDQAAQRLIAEARAMAKLSHPNVVAVYDVEDVPGGGLVIVMEYVAGETLRAWLGASDRDWRSMVGMFRAAGRGLAAAHAAGLLHRDFKPSNVLVADDVVKVTDFGLAKAGPASPSASTDGSVSVDDGGGDPALTAPSVVMGTPRYMSPEQHHAQSLTAAADQYAFCVALWEALCGAPPFSGRDLARSKREGPPPWSGPAIPRPIVEAIRRGLAPDPARRWPDIDALLVALARDSARRHKLWLAAAGGTGALALFMTAGQWWGTAQAQRCTPEGATARLDGVWDETRRAELRDAIVGVDVPFAARVWERTARELDAYATDWVAMHVDACAATTVRAEQSPEVMDLRMACLHRAKVELSAVAGVLDDADVAVVSKAHELTAGLRPLWRCADVEGLRAEVEPPRPEDAETVDAIRIHLAQAMAAYKAGRYEHQQNQVDAAKRLLDGVEYPPMRTEVAYADGFALDARGDYPAAEAAYTEALKLASTHRQWREMGDAAMQLLSLIGYRRQRFDEGLRYRQLAEGLTIGDPEREPVTRNSIAAILYAQGRYEEAESEGRQALAIQERALGPEHPSVAATRGNLAVFLRVQGRHEAAEAEIRRALDVLERELGPEHPYVATAHSTLANILLTQRRHDEAEVEYRRVLRSWDRIYGPEHPHVALARDNLAVVLHGLGRFDEAEREVRQAVTLREKLLGPEHPDVATARTNLGNILRAQGKLDEAEVELRWALARWEQALGPEHPHVAVGRADLASLLLEHGGRTGEALPLAEQAWNRHRHEAPPHDHAASAFVLAKVLWATGDSASRTRARTLAQESFAAYQQAGPAFTDDATTVESWLAEHPVRQVP